MVSAGFFFHSLLAIVGPSYLVLHRVEPVDVERLQQIRQTCRDKEKQNVQCVRHAKHSNVQVTRTRVQDQNEQRILQSLRCERDVLQCLA